MSKRPCIRVKGRSSEWRTHKLADLCDLFTDGDWIEAKDQSDSGIRLVQTGNVGVTEYLDKPNNKKWISTDTFDRLHCKEVLPGDILISRLPEPAGRACIVPATGTRMITAVDCTIVRIAPAYSKDFLIQYLSSPKYFKEVNVCLAGGTRQRISRSNLSQFSILLPEDKREQDTIGNTLGCIDASITLHQRKYDKLLTYKKAMLEKMFPKDGADVPEVRFAGYTSAWQLCTVGSVIEDCIEKNTVENQYPVLTSSQQHGILLQEDYFADRQVTTENNIGYYVLPRGYFSYRSRSDTNLFVFNRNDVIDKGIISYYYPVFRAKDCDSDFLLVRLNYRMESQIAMAAEGTGQKVLAHSKFKKMCMYVPELEEQIKIGSFFSKLENRILCQREYLVRLNAIKKSLLGKMFV